MQDWPEFEEGCAWEVAPQVGLEPTTLRLTAGCSTIELLRNREGSQLLRHHSKGPQAWQPEGEGAPGGGAREGVAAYPNCISGGTSGVISEAPPSA